MKTSGVLASSVVLAGVLGGCGGSSPSSGGGAAHLAIIPVSGASLHAVGGDALALEVVTVDEDGTTHVLPPGATVAWTAPGTVAALSPDSTADSPLPPAGDQPTAGWIANPMRPDRSADLGGVLFVFDPGTAGGTVRVSATVTGGTLPGDVTASVTVDVTPAGDATRGAALFGAHGANCAACHGVTGHGTDPSSDGPTFTIEGKSYDFPAPGLNAEDGNAGSDPGWNAALFAVASRSDMDNGGLTLRLPMPDWLSGKNPATGAVLTTQDFADIYAFMKTQTQ